LLAGVALSAGAVALDAYHLRLDGGLPFTQVALVLDLAIFLLALPLCILLLHRLRPNNSFKPTPLRGAA
jgi:hypothetical protein